MAHEFTLEDKTKVYWDISMSYRGRLPEKKCIPEIAFKRMNRVFEMLNPNSYLSTKLHELRQELVRGPELEDVPSETANLA